MTEWARTCNSTVRLRSAVRDAAPASVGSEVALLLLPFANDDWKVDNPRGLGAALEMGVLKV
jgi:hypothetical protein